MLSRLDPTGWRPTLIVAGLLALVVFGSLFLNALIPVSAGPGAAPGPGATPGPVAPGPVAPGQGVDLGNGVVIHPPNGWSSESLGTGQVRLVQGVAVVDVRLNPGFAGEATALVDSYVTEILRPQASQFSATPAQVIPLAAGAPGARATYVGTFEGISYPIEGQLTGVIIQGRPLLFDAYAPQGELASALGEVGQMIQMVEVR